MEPACFEPVTLSATSAARRSTVVPTFLPCGVRRNEWAIRTSAVERAMRRTLAGAASGRPLTSGQDAEPVQRCRSRDSAAS